MSLVIGYELSAENWSLYIWSIQIYPWCELMQN